MNNKDKIEALKRQLILHPSYLTIIEEIEKDLEKLEKTIKILKGRVCVHNGYVCYDTYADIKLKDEEIDLLYEVLEHEEI